MENCKHGFDYIMLQEPTCTEEGKEKQVCVICGYSQIVKIDKLEHQYASTYTIDKKATCTSAGSKSKHCVVCNAKTDITKIAKKSHSYKTVTTKATLAANGKKITKCSSCGKVKNTAVVYKPVTIKLNQTKYTYTGNAKLPQVTVIDSKGNTLKKGTDYTVSHSEGRREIGKYTVTVTFKGSYFGKKILTYYVLPGKTNCLTTSSTKTTIKASWEKVEGATGYKVELLSKSGKVLKTAHTTKLSYKFKDVSSKTTYQVRVRAYKTFDKVKQYAVSSVKVIRATYDPSLKIENLRQKKSGKGDIVLIFDEIQQDGIMYAARLEDRNGNIVIEGLADSVDAMAISELEYGGTYMFYVKALRQENRKANPTAEGPEVSLKVIMAPDMVKNFTQTRGNTTTSLTLKWDKVEGATSYRVTWGLPEKVDGKYQWTEKVVTGTSITISGLEKNTKYNVSIVAQKECKETGFVTESFGTYLFVDEGSDGVAHFQPR